MDIYKNKKQIIDYDFEAVDSSTFKLEFTVKNIKNRMMNLIFVKSKAKLDRRGIKIPDKHPDQVEKFDVPVSHLKLLGTVTKGMARDVFDEVKKDGIKVIRHNLIKAHFCRDDKRNWVCKIFMQGDYLDER